MCQCIDTCIRIVGCVIGSIEQFTVFVLYLILSMPFVYGTSRCITIAFVCFVEQVINRHAYINRFQSFQFESISEIQVAHTISIQCTVLLMSIV